MTCVMSWLGAITSRSNSGCSSNSSSTESSISRCCAVTQMRWSTPSAAASVRATMAILTASGRVPNTDRTRTGPPAALTGFMSAGLVLRGGQVTESDPAGSCWLCRASERQSQGPAVDAGDQAITTGIESTPSTKLDDTALTNGM